MRREDVSYYAEEIRELLSLSAIRQEVYEGEGDVIVRNSKDSLDSAFYNMRLLIEYSEEHELNCFVRAYLDGKYPKCEVIIY